MSKDYKTYTSFILVFLYASCRNVSGKETRTDGVDIFTVFPATPKEKTK